MEISSKIEELQARLTRVQRQKAELEMKEGRILGQLEICHRNQRLLEKDIPVCRRQPQTGVSTPHRLPISIGGGVADGVNGWRCGARGAGAGSTSRTGSCAASSATAAGPAG